MSLFFWLFTFAINLWHGKFVTADVTAVFVNNKHVNLLMRAFVSRDQSTLVHAYVHMLDLSLNTILLSGHHLTIRRVESVQSHFTKRIPGLRDFSYPHRRNVLSLDTLEPRRLHCDLTICYKIVFNIVKLEFNNFFFFIPVTATRGQTLSSICPLFQE